MISSTFWSSSNWYRLVLRGKRHVPPSITAYLNFKLYLNFKFRPNIDKQEAHSGTASGSLGPLMVLPLRSTWTSLSLSQPRALDFEACCHCIFFHLKKGLLWRLRLLFRFELSVSHTKYYSRVGIMNMLLFRNLFAFLITCIRVQSFLHKSFLMRCCQSTCAHASGAFLIHNDTLSCMSRYRHGHNYCDMSVHK